MSGYFGADANAPSQTPVASPTQRGVIEIATSADMLSSSPDTAVTPNLLAQGMGSPYCTVTGSANAVVLTPTTQGAPTSYIAGAQYRFRATSSNTSATTISIGGLIAKTAVTVTGVALPASYIRTDVDTVITYDAQGNRFVVGRELERGSNANGDFERLADGTQRCYFQAEKTETPTASGTITGVYQSTPLSNQLYPSSFIVAPAIGVQVWASAGSQSWAVAGGTSNGLKWNSEVRAFTTNSASNVFHFELTAIGRWY